MARGIREERSKSIETATSRVTLPNNEGGTKTTICFFLPFVPVEAVYTGTIPLAGRSVRETEEGTNVIGVLYPSPFFPSPLSLDQPLSRH